jgi:hypothetical protein
MICPGRPNQTVCSQGALVASKSSRIGTAPAYYVMRAGAAAAQNGHFGRCKLDAKMSLTVRDYIVRSNNPQTKIATEDYAFAVGQGFFWFSVALAERGPADKNMLCFRDGVALGRSIILQAANRAADNCKGSDPFEKALLEALLELFQGK